jgi:hypothetical protein
MRRMAANVPDRNAMERLKPFRAVCAAVILSIVVILHDLYVGLKPKSP